MNFRNFVDYFAESFFGGIVAEMFLLRRQFEKNLHQTRLNVEAVRTLQERRPTQNGKVQQVYRQIVSQAKISNGEKQEKSKVGRLTLINERAWRNFLVPHGRRDVWITDRLVAILGQGVSVCPPGAPSTSSRRCRLYWGQYASLWSQTSIRLRLG